MQPMPNEAEKRAGLTQMKRFATGLLVVFAVLFVVCHLLEPQHPAWSYARAFFEAGMVGALADWFAVTALFRHPLGLPIPHTALVPTQKDRIGQQLGAFVQGHFLTAEVIGQKLEALDPAGKASSWLSDRDNAIRLTGQVAVVLAGVIEVLRDEDVQSLIERAVLDRARQIQVAPLVGAGLSLMTSGDKHQELLSETLTLGSRLLIEHEDAMREFIRTVSPWYVPGFVDSKVHEKIVARTGELLDEVGRNPDHPLRHRFNEIVQGFIERLRTDPATIERGEALKEQLLTHPAVREYIAHLWLDLKTVVLSHAANPDSPLRGQLADALVKFGHALEADPALRAKVNGWLSTAVLYVLERYKNEIGALISDTVRRWNPAEMTERVELAIGRDLQFIRINGTVVGAIAGLVIYFLSRWF